MKKFLSILTLGAFLASAPFALAGACEGEACKDQNENFAQVTVLNDTLVDNGIIKGWTWNSGIAESRGPGLRTAEGIAVSETIGISTGHVNGWGFSGSFGLASTESTMQLRAYDEYGVNDPDTDKWCGLLGKYTLKTDQDLERVEGTVSGGVQQYNGSTAVMGNSLATAWNLTGGSYFGHSDDYGRDSLLTLDPWWGKDVTLLNNQGDEAQVNLNGRSIGGGFTTTYALDLGPVAFAGAKTVGGSLSYQNGEEGCVNAGGFGGVSAYAVADGPAGWAVAQGTGNFNYDATAPHVAAGIGTARTDNFAATIVTPHTVHQHAVSTASASSISGGF